MLYLGSTFAVCFLFLATSNGETMLVLCLNLLCTLYSLKELDKKIILGGS